MTQFLVRASSPLGGHRRLQIFARELPTQTWANCGELHLTLYEADAFRAAFSYHEWRDE